jgi:quercetin dioxygenase-like cupin family protein
MSTFLKTKGEFHPKGWGHEEWVVNSEKYCGKILRFDSGKRCSWHYHKIKDEVFYLLSGKMELRVSNEDDLENAQVLFLEKGDTFHVETGMRHQMIALEDSELLEVSTQHFEDDSIRLKKGD